MQDLIFFLPEKRDFKLINGLRIKPIIAGNFSKEEIKDLRKKYTDFKICKILNVPDTRQLQIFRNLANIVAINGKSLKHSSFAIKQKVPILLQPFDANRLYFDVGLAADAKKKTTIVAINFSELLNASLHKRTMLMRNLNQLAKILQKYNLPLKIFSCASHPYELRSLKDMRFLLEFLGFSPTQAKKFIELEVA